MKLTIKHQERYSRGELLLRTLFGWLYILIPHGFLLIFVGLWGMILQFVAFWVILFTGRYPESMFEFQAGLMRWNLRLNARLYNVSDGYPAFGVKSTDEFTNLVIPYPEKVSRGLTLVRMLFGIFFVLIPHGFILVFRAWFVGILIFLAWWIVLFTAKFPDFAFKWVTGQIRWQIRVNLYMMYMTDTYPPFTGDELTDENPGESIKAE